MSTFFPFFDVMNIPDVMGIAYRVMFGIAWALFPLMFIMAAVSAASAPLGLFGDADGIDWKKFLMQTVACAVGLSLSAWIFLKIVALGEVIGNMIVSRDDFLIFINALHERNLEMTSINILRWGKTWMLALSGAIVLIAEDVFLLLRYALLCILYVLSPLAFVFAVYKPTRKMLGGWFSNVFIISFWIVTMRIVESIIISLNIDFAKAGSGDIIPITVLNVFFIIMIILVPVISSKIFSNEHLGTVGSLALGAATAIGANISKASSTANKGVDKVKDVVLGKPGGPEPPRSGGLRDAVLGQKGEDGVRRGGLFRDLPNRKEEAPRR